MYIVLFICRKRQHESIHSRFSVGGGEDGLLEDAADVVGTDLDVAVGTPGRAPRVLDEEVVLAVLGAVADSEDTVVEALAAAGGENTGVVELEGGLVGLNGDGDGALGNTH